MNRAERKRQQRGHIITGWTKHPSPKDKKTGSGWFRQLDRVYRRNDGMYVCMMRDIQTAWGKVTHVTITAARGKPQWAEKQRIKNELFGLEAVAVEVFPKESELVDHAEMYHLWVLHDTEIPFGID